MSEQISTNGCHVAETQSEDHLSHEAGNKMEKETEENCIENQQKETDPSQLSRSQKERIIDESLKKRRYKRRRSRRKLTVADVKAEAVKILEEYLLRQLSQQSVQTSPPEYQRFVDVNIRETTTPSGESSVNLASSSSILREDSIPYADEDDAGYELRKSESLPHDEFATFKGTCPSQNLPIHHAKSRSAPYQGGEEAVYRPKKKAHGSVKPPPPAPPGTPYSPSDNSSNGSSSQVVNVPYTGSLVPTNSVHQHSAESVGVYTHEESPSAARKLSPASVHKTSGVQTSESSRSGSHTPVSEASKENVSVKSETSVRPKTLMDSPRLKPSPNKTSLFGKVKYSGSVSSSDTDGLGSYHTEGRKKKSMFKKAQERLHHMLNLKKSRSSTDENVDVQSAGSGDRKPKHRKRPKRHGKDKEKIDECDDADTWQPDSQTVVEDRYIHTNKHIHQTHSQKDRNTVVRSEESLEIVDIVNDKEEKHLEKHKKLKESSGTGGLMGRFKKLTSRDKTKKIKGSQSTHFRHDLEDGMCGVAYTRGVSVPDQTQEYGLIGQDQTDNPHLTMYGNNRGFEFSNLHTDRIDPNTREISATQVVCREEGRDAGMQRHSSYLDIVDHSGQMIERMYFDEDGHQLPKNKSFELEHETYVHEQLVNDNGELRVIRDLEHHDHLEITEGRGGEGKRFADLSDGEKDELYGMIASRLAAMGDNLITERELEQSRGSTASPRFKVPELKVLSPEPELTSSSLNPLEKEISDVLKEVAADVDDKLAADARRAALRITGLITYSHFKNVIQDSVGHGDGWDQVAAVFHITKRAIQMAGASGALAMQIKEMSLKYIEDRFAGWIVGQGGWDSMLSDTETDSEVD